jgi:release factor glutamine methyltransferase
MSTFTLKNKTMETNKQNIGKLLSKGKNLLMESGNSRAEHESVLFLSYLLHRGKSDLFLNRDLPVSKQKIRQYFQWILDRSKGVPFQYITGLQNFMGLEFEVAKGVFIPRAETEILVEKVIQLIELLPEKKEWRLLDIGVGSGVIPISICSYFQKKDQHIHFCAIDVSQKALALAQKNARKFHCQKKIDFYQGDLFQALEDWQSSMEFDGIISNPPYISKKEWDTLSDEIRLYEPTEALLGGEQGLHFYLKIISQSPKFLKAGGFLAFEIGHQQKKLVHQIIADNPNFKKDIITFPDYFQNDRVIITFKASPKSKLRGKS